MSIRLGRGLAEDKDSKQRSVALTDVRNIHHLRLLPSAPASRFRI
jgi:hypothetical protein